MTRFLRRSGTPVTFAAIAVAVFGFLLAWGSSARGPAAFSEFLFHPDRWAGAPWTLMTYAVFSFDLLLLFWVVVGMYFFASPLEGAWGSRRFGTAFLGLVVLTPLCFWLGYLVVGRSVPLYSLAVPTTGCLVAWAGRNPNAQILLWFVLPIQAKWVAWFAAIATVLGASWGAPALAPFVAMPLAAAFIYSTGKFRLLAARQRKGLREGDYRGPDYEKRMQAEYERRRLKELFERSLIEDPEDDEGKSR